ncbi:MAG: tRNA (adenine-N1)-methyltransferase [Actinomycetota bacterium]|nr:tRNA (adenine-N1)-methyltransferase [Actinomycetota bacterium]
MSGASPDAGAPGAAPGAAPATTGRGALAAGERVLLIDPKQRRYLIRLEPGGRFQTHAGILEHDDVIGAPEGCEALARRGDELAARRFLVLRPTLADLVLKMPRGAQVIYPKDLGAILLAADLFPGARVLEAGVGSGALSMAALRAGCVVTGYELREDFAATARSNVAALLGDEARYEVQLRDVYEGIDPGGFDRILLDLPEPWRVVPHAEVALVPGGILCCYLPGINQTAELRAALDKASFGLAETSEVLRRTWYIEGRSVRPDHRMVAHTGFLTTARRILPRDG